MNIEELFYKEDPDLDMDLEFWTVQREAEKAYCNGLTQSKNPYNKGSWRHEWWNISWEEAIDNGLDLNE